MAIALPSFDGMAEGVEFPAEEYISHTLPVVYISTTGNTPITSKEDYVEATCYIDAMGSEEYASLGDIDHPIPLLIKGRGNTSWSKPKKPYRLKCDQKVAPLGMHKNRHFVLGAEWGEGHGRINWETGFFVSQLMGLPWTPAHIPVELVINGEYMGLYFLTEKIRVGTHRVNIEEQDDEETNPEKVTGGWLCEIDNYEDEPQVKLRDRTTGKYVLTTVHSPEVLSEAQSAFIKNLVTGMDNAIYCRDKTSTEWENLIDLDALVRYYLVCEVVNQIEGFSGSCYWWKDRGENSKVNFGPLWDFDTSNAKWTSFKFCYENNDGDVIVDRNHWIMEIAKYPRFQQRVREIWQEYCDNSAALVEPHALEFVEKVRAAAQCDIGRWKAYYTDPVWKNTTLRAQMYLERLRARHEWLCEQWSKPVRILGDVDGNGTINNNDLETIRHYLLTQPIDTLSFENANTYDDNVIDISDLVGVVRCLYKINNPNATLPYPPSVPYGVNDKEIRANSFITLDNLPMNNVWHPGMIREIGICVGGIDLFSAFSIDIAKSTFINIKELRVEGVNNDDYQIFRQDIDSETTRIIGYSNDLYQVEVFNAPIIKLTIEVNRDVPANGNYLGISNILLAGADMYPTRLPDMYMPINMRALKGDVDGNNIIDVEDVNGIINIILKTSSADNYIIANADINGDGRIDVEDVNALINYILHI